MTTANLLRVAPSAIENYRLLETGDTALAQTPGNRLYLIRLACGDQVRKAESLEDFSARVYKATKRQYDPSALSRLERMKQGWDLTDVHVLASVDPLKRGPVWLAFGDPRERELPAAQAGPYTEEYGGEPAKSVLKPKHRKAR